MSGYSRMQLAFFSGAMRSGSDSSNAVEPVRGWSVNGPTQQSQSRKRSVTARTRSRGTWKRGGVRPVETVTSERLLSPRENDESNVRHALLSGR
jgi:hypothetical protein